MKKELIEKIKQFFLDNGIEEEVDLRSLGRNFETSSGTEEGAIEIIKIGTRHFIYTPAGHDDEIDGGYDVLSNGDLAEILDALDDYKTDMDKTMEKARG